MSQVPLKLKELHCERLGAFARIKKTKFQVDKLLKTLAAANPKKRGFKRLPLFVPIEPLNSETDSHLHLLIQRSSTGEEFDLELILIPVSRRHEGSINPDISLENIASWLGSAIDGEIPFGGSATFEYKGGHFKPVIPLPYRGVIPIESAIVRKSSIAGVDVVVEESDIGLERFFLYKPNSDTLALSILFLFSHAVNYALFVKLFEQAQAISSLLVTKEAQK